MVEAFPASQEEAVSLLKEEALEASHPLLASVEVDWLEFHPASRGRLVESSI